MVGPLARGTALVLVMGVAACGGNTSADVQASSGGSGGAETGAGGTECGSTSGTGLTSSIIGNGEGGASACSDLWNSVHGGIAVLAKRTLFQCSEVPEDPQELIVESVLPERLTFVGQPFVVEGYHNTFPGLPPLFSPGEVVIVGKRAFGPVPDGWEYVLGPSGTLMMGSSLPVDVPQGPHIEAEPQCFNEGCSPCGAPVLPRTAYALRVSIGAEKNTYIPMSGGVGVGHADQGWIVHNSEAVEFQDYCSKECGPGVDPLVRIVVTGPALDLGS